MNEDPIDTVLQLRIAAGGLMSTLTGVDCKKKGIKVPAALKLIPKGKPYDDIVNPATAPASNTRASTTTKQRPVTAANRGSSNLAAPSSRP